MTNFAEKTEQWKEHINYLFQTYQAQ